MKKKEYKNFKDLFKKSWNYIWHDDSAGSYLANFIVAFLIIKFLLFPVISFGLNSELPITAIVSGSMEHKVVNGIICDNTIVNGNKLDVDINKYWDFCGSYYENFYNISLSIFSNFSYKNGLDTGDVMVIYGKDYSNIKLGDVIVFVPNDRRILEEKGHIIHRVIKIWQDDGGKYHFKTKGDHNGQSYDSLEKDISQDDVVGVAVFRVPYIGYAKIALNNIFVGFLRVFNN